MDLNSLRKKIDKIDNKIVSLYSKRMETVEKIAEIKKREGIEIADEKREKELLLKIEKNPKNKYKKETEKLYEGILKTSKEYQKSVGEK